MLNGSSPTVVVAGVDRGGASVPVWDLIYFWITRSCEEPWFTTICYLTGGRLPVFCRGGFCSKGSRNLEEFQVFSRVFKILNICFRLSWFEVREALLKSLNEFNSNFFFQTLVLVSQTQMTFNFFSVYFFIVSTMMIIQLCRLKVDFQFQFN